VGNMKSSRIGMLLVAAATAACETPRVDTGPVGAPSSYYVNTPPESGVGRISRECELGKKLSCYLLARAYEKGEAPVTAGGEIVVRDMHRAAYYHGKACALGAMWSCYNLAEQYLKGDGVEQNSSKAARLYSTGCESREVLDYPTGASCAALGDLYMRGHGVRFNFKTGLALLKRACAMGAERGCKLRDTYGGTGLLSEATVPDGALGFMLGWSREEARTACVQGHGSWSTEPTGAAGGRYFCDMRAEVLDHDAVVQLVFVKDRLAGLSAAYDVDQQAAPKEFLRVGDLLIRIYGLPSDRVYEVLDECGTRTLGDCIKGKLAAFSMSWFFKDGHAISSSLNSSPDEPMYLMLEYETQESLKGLPHKGL
jgi:TPR repeat protein